MDKQLEQAQAELVEATNEHTQASEAKKKAKKEGLEKDKVQALFALEKAAGEKKKDAKKRVDELTKQIKAAAAAAK